MEETPKQEYCVQTKLTIIAEKSVKASSFGEAVELVKKMKVTDYVTFKVGVSHSDSNNPEIVGISTGSWLD